MSKKTKILFQLLGPAIFVYILFQIDYRVFFEKAQLLKWYFLFLAFSLIILQIIVKSLRWRTILSSLGISISRLSCLSLYWLGLFVGIITPGRLGEVIKVYFLKNRGASIFRSFFSVVLDRIIDILILLLVGLLIFFFFLKDIGVYIIFFGLILLLIIIFILLLIDQRSYLHKVFGGLIQKIFPVDFKDYSRFTFSKFWQGIKGLKRGEVIYFFIYLILGWLLYFGARYMIALSLGLNLSFIEVIIISSLVMIVTILPISIAGFGTREAAIIYLFSLFNLNKEIALLFSLLIFISDIVPISLGLVPYFKESALIDKIKQVKK